MSSNWRTDEYLALRRDAEYLSNSFLIKARLLKCGVHRGSTIKKVDCKSDLIAFLETIASAPGSQSDRTLTESPFHKLDLAQVVLSATYSQVKKGVVVFCSSLFVKRVLKRFINRGSRSPTHVRKHGQFARDLTPGGHHVTYHRCVRVIRDQFKELVRRGVLSGLWINPIAYMLDDTPTLLPRVVLEWKTGFEGTPEKYRSPLVSLLLHPGIKSVRSGEVRFREGAFGLTTQMESRLEVFPRQQDAKCWSYLFGASTARVLAQAEKVYSGRTGPEAPNGLNRFLMYPALRPLDSSTRQLARQVVQARLPERRKLARNCTSHRTQDANPTLDPSYISTSTETALPPNPNEMNVPVGLVEQSADRDTSPCPPPSSLSYRLSPLSSPESWPSLRAANALHGPKSCTSLHSTTPSSPSPPPETQASPLSPLSVMSPKISVIPFSQANLKCSTQLSRDVINPCRRSERIRSKQLTLADFLGQ